MITLASTGYIQVHAYTSTAQIPLEGVAILITDSNGKTVSARLTNRSGLLDTPIPISVPDRSASLTPSSGTVPFTIVNIYARLSDYEQIEVENVQVFPETTTLQNLEMIPLAEYPEEWGKTEIFDTPPQNL